MKEDSKDFLKATLISVTGLLLFIVVLMWVSKIEATSVFVRYPVGQPVPAEVYTAPFDPCDPAYKFMQAPPKDWAEKFGNNERTMLIHAVSELRVVVAAQSKRLLALEDWQKKHDALSFKDTIPAKDPNEAIHIEMNNDDGKGINKTYVGTKGEIENALIRDGVIAPNEAKP